VKESIILSLTSTVLNDYNRGNFSSLSHGGVWELIYGNFSQSKIKQQKCIKLGGGI